MEEATGGICVACGNEATKLNEEGMCEYCTGGGEPSEMDPADESPMME